jgi:hypothetical protein
MQTYISWHMAATRAFGHSQIVYSFGQISTLHRGDTHEIERQYLEHVGRHCDKARTGIGKWMPKVLDPHKHRTPCATQNLGPGPLARWPSFVPCTQGKSIGHLIDRTVACSQNPSCYLANW